MATLILFFLGSVIAAGLSAYGTFYLIAHSLEYIKTRKEHRNRRKNDLRYVKIL